MFHARRVHSGTESIGKLSGENFLRPMPFKGSLQKRKAISRYIILQATLLSLSGLLSFSVCELDLNQAFGLVSSLDCPHQRNQKSIRTRHTKRQSGGGAGRAC